MNNITFVQQGRLGNILFEAAAAYAYALNNGMKFGFPNNDDTKEIKESLFKNIPITELEGSMFGNLEWHRELRHEYHPIQLSNTQNSIIQGYFQSEKYFIDQEKSIREMFELTEYDSIIEFENSCSIHVRMGDYLNYPDRHPVVTFDYIKQAIDYVISKTKVECFNLYTDDYPNAYELFNEVIAYTYGKYQIPSFLETHNDMYIEFASMAKNSHNIISNSTYSWWAAWLNKNRNKVVVSPSKDNWFGTGNSHLSTIDIIPESWYQIKY